MTFETFDQSDEETWPDWKNTYLPRHHICQIFYTSTVSGFWKFTRKKRVNRDILNLKYYIFGAFTHSIGVISQFSYVNIHICSLYTLSMGKTWFNLTKNWIMLLQFDLKHIHKVNFYPSDNNFTQALLVLLVTNMISVPPSPLPTPANPHMWRISEVLDRQDSNRILGEICKTFEKLFTKRLQTQLSQCKDLTFNPSLWMWVWRYGRRSRVSQWSRRG